MSLKENGMNLKSGLVLLAIMATLIVIALLEPWKNITSDTKATASEARASAVYREAMELYNQNSVEEAYQRFQLLTDNYPGDAEMWAWRAEAARRLGKNDDCMMSARAALRIDPCNSFAHCVLGDLYNPQYGPELGNADSTWKHLLAAVECNPDEGNAWMSVWIEAMRRGDATLETKALERLRKSGFFAECSYALNTWALRLLPRDCVFITGGDLDTYPALCLQAVDGYRADVAVINVNLLNMPWYVELMATRWQLPLPLSRQAMENYIPEPETSAEDGTPVYTLLSDVVLRSWSKSKSSGALAKPMMIASTCEPGIHRNWSTHLRSVGYGYEWVQNGTDKVDAASVTRSLEGLDGAALAGRPWTEMDKSSVRRSVAAGFAAGPPLFAGLVAAQQLAGEGKKQEATSLLATLRTLARSARVETEYAEYFGQLETALK